LINLLRRPHLRRPVHLAASSPGAAGVLVPIAHGDAGIAATVAIMRGQVLEAMQDRRVKTLAAGIVCGMDPDDKAEMASRIYFDTQKRFRFVDDTYGVEEIISPRIMVQEIETSGSTFGDCDELSMLQATLLRAVGIPARFVTWAGTTNGGNFDHVFAQAWVNGKWVDMDWLPAHAMEHVREAYWSI
jgi:transglutaminase-like putative cysteine protease